ncbi:MAG TPA: mannosyltransferase family protein [Actinomycetes bacterium]|nr:mannosyltransferase family protein [Actinomycetes bacterium]
MIRGVEEWRSVALVLCSRVIVLGFLLLSAFTDVRGTRHYVPFLPRLVHWDAFHYLGIAKFGYGLAMASDHPSAAFFPGFPATIRVVHFLGVDYVISGVIISLVGTLVAAVALARIAALDGHPEDGPWAVAFLLLAPAAVFLAVPYTEGLFLGLALPAWLFARRREWWWAGILCGVSMFVRVDGLFLLTALVVEWLTKDRPRRLADAAWLSIPIGAAVALEVFYVWLTGEVLGWLHAEQIGWHRSFAWPWRTAHNTIPLVFPRHGFVWTQLSSGLDLIALVVAVVVTVVLCRERRWGEAVLVGLPFVMLSTSTRLWSLDRATLLAWPIFLLLARLARRHEWITWSYVTVGLCLGAVVMMGYASGAWVG